ncbi:hypothetical protein [Curtobacterium sp. MCPF17_052]|uniref:hypothetical protein n=1 Tax=Curtobacterium sp. MCPF17_052 TaxID=2175655 RepID=UPI0024DF4676|nr:hypothetical protein [Curtobacterium sp. MCPF17_052]WIB12922.1 hypothetical protein DEJ36_02570 [Curtobacterium sp. MCPF17_052]
MLGTLLDVADGEGRSRPAPGELAELRWQGVRERVNAVVPGDVRVLAASIGTGAAAGFALVYLLAVSWVPWGQPPGTAWPDMPGFGPFRNPGVLFAVPVLLGALAALGRQRMLAHLAGLLAVLGIVVARVTVQATENWNGPGTTTLVTVAALVVVANVGAPRDRRALGIAFGVVAGGLALFVGLQLPTGHPFESTLLTDGAWWGAGVTPALLGVVGGARAGRGRRTRPTSAPRPRRGARRGLDAVGGRRDHHAPVLRRRGRGVGPHGRGLDRDGARRPDGRPTRAAAVPTRARVTGAGGAGRCRASRAARHGR